MLVPTQIWRSIESIFLPFSCSSHVLALALLCEFFLNLLVGISTSSPSLSLPSHPGHFCQVHFPRIVFFLRKTTKKQTLSELIVQNLIYQFWYSGLLTKRPSQFYSHFLNANSFTQSSLLYSLLPSTSLHFSFLTSLKSGPSVGYGMHLLVQSLLSAMLELSATLTIPLLWGWKLFDSSGPQPLAS